MLLPQWQLPPKQLSAVVESQTLPQPPQLLKSRWMLVSQGALQVAYDESQMYWQVLDEQVPVPLATGQSLLVQHVPVTQAWLQQS